MELVVRKRFYFPLLWLITLLANFYPFPPFAAGLSASVGSAAPFAWLRHFYCSNQPFLWLNCGAIPGSCAITCQFLAELGLSRPWSVGLLEKVPQSTSLIGATATLFCAQQRLMRLILPMTCWIVSGLLLNQGGPFGFPSSLLFLFSERHIPFVCIHWVLHTLLFKFQS